ncbi:MAG TPA: hypothetical protein VKS79_16110 [Gemmataceae bacterium]|nr:hypothetical protein [Gemmataceae bacterium]
MRGRRPSGPEFVHKLHGSELAKHRAEVLLETLAGTCRTTEACVRLKLSEQRFDQVRLEALQALVTSLELGTGGRPAKRPTQAELEVAQLRQQIAELKVQLQAALVRTELALTLTPAAKDESKKSARSPGRKRSRRPSPRKR